MKKRISLATVLILLVLLLSVVPAQALSGPNGQPSSPQGQKTSGPLYPGVLIKGSSVLSNVAPYDYDRYEFDAYGPGYFVFEVRDCCILGDTMAAYATNFALGKVKTDVATSPDYISIGFWVDSFASIRIYVGYVAAPGGLPAGYDWRVAVIP